MDTIRSRTESRFTLEQRHFMLELARKAIVTYLEQGREIVPPQENFLNEPSGAFVTLTRRGMLRGCIGALEALLPLGETIAKCAVSSAVRDPRFSPLQIEELDQLHVEISVISPMQLAKDPEEIIVGTHGVMIELQNRRGLLLPQVPVEHQWDRDTFLRHVCIKAGLNPDEWRNPTARLQIFTAEVFGEED
jgi:AmmeMemoRadiSam system protein A